MKQQPLSDYPEPDTIRAQQKAKRNGALGILGTALGTSLSIIAYLVQMNRAQAEKEVLAARAASAVVDMQTVELKLDYIRQDLVAIRERLARVETRLDERQQQRKP